MSLHIFRATVRGHFADLDDETRARLLAEVDDHSIFRSAYTAAGTFSYEPNLVAFNFRYEIRARGDDPQVTAEASARHLAEGHLREAGIGHKHLRVNVVDMADIWSGT